MRLSHKNSVAASFIWKEERHMEKFVRNFKHMRCDIR